ncbi:hypothetical protein SAMN06297129_1552 [Pseudooceanicola antarcticus]|uniref:Chemoreceptor zinc-binding domain-containing protein n=1 Tax=Pseudooceanicola antarcticus TaxID=1247613 RepID=A0A285ILF0_9RHOB|nr:hypothetical protein [Pseudooceanicola antarcticus]PJE28627.1 hypothetical protein CVM39_09100 [Pseudooceanicola antarcticus]SNY48723.1 hypothetical protein SAMN06297129_1552 [Pseudooceanicola antarcticus]
MPHADQDWSLLDELELARSALDRWQSLHLEMALRLRRGQRSGLKLLPREDESQCRMGRCLAELRRRHPGDPWVAELCQLHEDFHAFAHATQRMIAAGEAEAALAALTGLEFEGRRGALTERICALIARAA